MVTTATERAAALEDKYYAFTNDLKAVPEFAKVYKVEHLNVRF